MFVSSYHGYVPVADTISGFLSISCSSRIVTPFVLVTVIVPVVPYSRVSPSNITNRKIPTALLGTASQIPVPRKTWPGGGGRIPIKF